MSDKQENEASSATGGEKKSRPRPRRSGDSDRKHRGGGGRRSHKKSHSKGRSQGSQQQYVNGNAGPTAQNDAYSQPPPVNMQDDDEELLAQEEAEKEELVIELTEEERKELYAAVYESEHWKNNIAPRIPELMDRSAIQVTRIVPTAKSVAQ